MMPLNHRLFSHLPITPLCLLALALVLLGLAIVARRDRRGQ